MKIDLDDRFDGGISGWPDGWQARATDLQTNQKVCKGGFLTQLDALVWLANEMQRMRGDRTYAD